MNRSDTSRVLVSKSRRVLHYDLELSDRANGVCVYTQRDEETGHVTTAVHLLPMDVGDFGEPVSVTVTIQPGDRLNA